MFTFRWVIFVSFICAPAILGAFAQASTSDDDVNLIDSQDVKVREAAYKRLNKGGRGAITAVVKGMEGASREKKLMLLDVLKSVKESNKGLAAQDADTKSLARLARGENDRSLRFRMISSVRDVGGAAAISELERFASEDPEEKIRAEATHFVGARAGKNIQFFRKQSKDPSKLVRHYANFELARLGDKSGRELALQTLKESAASDERRLAVSTIGEIGSSEDAALLRQISKSSTDDYGTKIMAAEAAMTIDLLQLPAGSRLSYLIKSLDDSDAAVRQWAYSRLWNLPDPQTTPRLKAYLSEPGHKGYKEATDALSAR